MSKEGPIGVPNGNTEKKPELSRAAMKAAESNETRLKILGREMRELKMRIMEKQESYNQGTQGIEVAVDEKDTRAKALRELRIQVGRVLNEELMQLRAKEAALKEEIKEKGGDPEDPEFTVQ